MNINYFLIPRLKTKNSIKKIPISVLLSLPEPVSTF